MQEREPLSLGGERSLCVVCSGPGYNVHGRVRACNLEQDGCVVSEPARIRVPKASSCRSSDTPMCSLRWRTAEHLEFKKKEGGEEETGASELLEASWQQREQELP